jgi:ketosteroid isomerase-like protein
MVKTSSITALLLLLSACAVVPGREQRPRITVAEAEKNFAADAQTRTVQDAFLTAFATDAIMFRPTPVNAHQSLAARPFPADLQLRWTPTSTETAAAGDYAISTGPSDNGKRGQPPAGTGYFLSVWRATGDKWQVVFDAGISGPVPVSIADASKTLSRRTLQPSPSHSDDIEQMRNDVLHLERTLIDDYVNLLRNHATSDLHLYRNGHAPTANIGQAIGLISGEDDVEWTPGHGYVSRSGDLAYVYGVAKTDKGEAGYIRIYRNQDGNWKVSYDLR